MKICLQDNSAKDNHNEASIRDLVNKILPPK